MIVIKVLKEGKPQKSVAVSYTKDSIFGGSGSEKITDSQGCVSYNSDPGMATVYIKGRSYRQYLQHGENVFHIPWWCIYPKKQKVAKKAAFLFYFVFDFWLFYI